MTKQNKPRVDKKEIVKNLTRMAERYEANAEFERLLFMSPEQLYREEAKKIRKQIENL